MRFVSSIRLSALMGNGGISFREKMFDLANNFAVGESLSIVFRALFMVNSFCFSCRGISPASAITETFGDDLKAPEQRRRPVV